MSNARDKANIPALNFSSTGIDDNATSTAITIDSSGKAVIGKTTVDSEISKLQLFGTSPGTGSGGQLGLQGSETTGAINTGGGIAFKGGRLFVVMTALSTLCGVSLAGVEFYKDYMDMKEIVQNIDVDAIRQERELLQQELNSALAKVDEAIEYTRDIKSGLRDDILGIEKQADRVEDMVRETEDEVRATIQNAEERFDQKRDALQSDYDRKASALRDNTEQKLKDLEDRLNSRLQLALDNPLSN